MPGMICSSSPIRWPGAPIPVVAWVSGWLRERAYFLERTVLPQLGPRFADLAEAEHARMLAIIEAEAAAGAPVVVKQFADSFEQTNLTALLTDLGVTDLLVCGMMTQNCVTHTAISKAAEKYSVTVLIDCCTTVSEILHLIALHGMSTRVKLAPSSAVL